MSAVLTEIIGLLTSGLVEMAQGIGGGLTALARNIFLEEITEGGTTTTQLSAFGGLIIIFAGVSLAIGLSRWITNWLTSLGSN